MNILEVLTVVFVTLKLIGISAIATCSWWIVLSPMIANILIRVALSILDKE
jgi:hypothetical protein